MLSTLYKATMKPHAARMIGLRALATQAQTQAANLRSKKTSNASSSSSSLVAMASLLGLTAGAGAVTLLEKPAEKPVSIPTTTQTKDPSKPDFNRPPSRPDLPTYRLEEVAEHCDEESLWYTFRGGVYDLVL